MSITYQGNFNVSLFKSTTGTRKRYLETNIQAPTTNDFSSAIKYGSCLTVAEQFPFFVLTNNYRESEYDICPADRKLEMGLNVKVNINAS
jgi:hypothetical protein